MRGAPQMGFCREIRLISSNHLVRDARSPHRTGLALVTPPHAPGLAMLPGDDRLGLDQPQRPAPLLPPVAEHDPERAVQ